MTQPHERTLGLFGATAVGVGAIVGGGILALAGVAFATTGPGAIVAFALNGVIAVVTALSFAEMSARFPESGGTYTFAKKVLRIETAFGVGWVVWFASIVAAVLYALGFAAFAAVIIEEVWTAATGAHPPAWLHERPMDVALALAATALFTGVLLVRGGGGGAWINVAKVLVFAVLLAGGLWIFAGSPAGTLRSAMTPFFPGGGLGLIQAMGFTFIALQGFDLIAAVAGDVRDPGRNLPRSMLLALGIALAIYLPLLFVITTVGVPAGTTIAEASAEDPETIVAVAAEHFLGPFGYWLVLAAGVLSMLSALQANLYAASRVALAMAHDRTLPRVLERVTARRRTPVAAVVLTAALVALLIVLIPDVAAAGAAASLIFLVTFGLVHAVTVLARRRAGVQRAPFRVPLFPVLPIAGGLACLALAAFEGVMVPRAGMIAAAWLCVGGLLFIVLFARRARVRDAAHQARDPHLLRLRGRNPLVLVPIANPARAEAMVAVAHALAPPYVGRVLLLTVVTVDEGEGTDVAAPLAAAQAVLGEALTAAHAAGYSPAALTTLAPQPWAEIARVAKGHDCETLLVGLSDLETRRDGSPLEKLMGRVEYDAVVLRSPSHWMLADARRILVPVAGRSHHDVLRARLIGSLARTGDRDITYLRIVPADAPPDRFNRIKAILRRVANDESRGMAEVLVLRSDDVPGTVVEQAAAADLVILGLERKGPRSKRFGRLTLRVARETDCAMLMVSRRG